MCLKKVDCFDIWNTVFQIYLWLVILTTSVSIFINVIIWKVMEKLKKKL